MKLNMKSPRIRNNPPNSTQGKVHGLALLHMELDVPDNLLK